MENKVINTGMSQYDMEKRQYMNVEPLDTSTIETNINEISHAMEISSSYFMLLNNERKDYTIFRLSHSTNYEEENLKHLLLDTLINRGEIMDMMDGIEENSWKIWIRDGEECYAYFLFDYTGGVVEV